jgi:tetratricopeptide (TPR) repeat protein
MLRIKPIFLFFLFLSSLIAGVFSSSISEAGQEQAQEFYHQGISAKTIGEREQYFEKALAKYIDCLNNLKEKDKDNGWLYYNIANCYFNLKQIGEAVYYYRLGLKLLPGNEKLISNLSVTLEKREKGIDVEAGGVKETLLFFHYKISTKNRISFLIGFSILLSLGFTGSIFKSNNFLRYFNSISGLITISLFISVAIEYYSPEYIGIIINQTDVRRDAGTGFAPITPASITPGSSIRVLGLENNWYQVKLNDGRKGFIRQQDLKLII